MANWPLVFSFLLQMTNTYNLDYANVMNVYQNCKLVSDQTSVGVLLSHVVEETGALRYSGPEPLGPF